MENFFLVRVNLVHLESRDCLDHLALLDGPALLAHSCLFLLVDQKKGVLIHLQFLR